MIAETENIDSLRIGTHTLASRLIVGTGKYATYDLMREALELSGCDCITVAVRRERLVNARGENIRASHNQFLQDWYERYGEPLSIALTDTFTTKFFFSDFTKEQAEAWRGVRHDSGDPVVFGETLLAFYEQQGVDPATKTLIFSDGLDIGQIVSLHKHFAGRINVLFGWGTTLTNDLGIKPLNIVMKATHVRLAMENIEADTVKLSDNSGKHTGPQQLVEEYAHEYFQTAA